MDAGPLRVLDGAPGLVNVIGMGPGQGGDDGPLTSRAMAETASKSPGELAAKPRLDDVHVHPLELPGDFHLLGPGHADASRLLAVAESGVQEQNFVVACHFFLYLKFPF